jgi:hypothetical protein
MHFLAASAVGPASALVVCNDIATLTAIALRLQFSFRELIAQFYPHFMNCKTPRTRESAFPRQLGSYRSESFRGKRRSSRVPSVTKRHRGVCSVLRRADFSFPPAPDPFWPNLLRKAGGEPPC